VYPIAQLERKRLRKNAVKRAPARGKVLKEDKLRNRTTRGKFEIEPQQLSAPQTVEDKERGKGKGTQANGGGKMTEKKKKRFV